MTSVKELRKFAIDARRENSNERRERYIRARDEAFETLTDGVMEKVLSEAKRGQFRYKIFNWTTTGRNQNTDSEGQSEENSDDTHLYFGKDESGKNGVHIMALMVPRGIQYEETLVHKLREFFNSQMASPEDNTDDQNQKRNQPRVFLERSPSFPRQRSIVVSWDRPNPTHVQRGAPFIPRQRPQTAPVVHLPQEEAVQRPRTRTFTPKPGVLRPQIRGALTERGTTSFRGAPQRGRGGRGGGRGGYSGAAHQ